MLAFCNVVHGTSHRTYRAVRSLNVHICPPPPALFPPSTFLFLIFLLPRSPFLRFIARPNSYALAPHFGLAAANEFQRSDRSTAIAAMVMLMHWPPGVPMLVVMSQAH